MPHRAGGKQQAHRAVRGAGTCGRRSGTGQRGRDAAGWQSIEWASQDLATVRPKRAAADAVPDADAGDGTDTELGDDALGAGLEALGPRQWRLSLGRLAARQCSIAK
jgi:hypothetical protein